METKCKCVEFSDISIAKDKHICCIISGGSRGFGKAIFQMILQCTNSCKSITCLLLGRNEENIKKLIDFANKLNDNRINVVYGKDCHLDLAKASKSDIERCLKLLPTPTSETICILFNNAGTVGKLSKFDFDSFEESNWESYININLLSMIALTGAFLKYFSCSKYLCIVNITSLCSIQPFNGMSQYCSIKAAREMFMRCLSIDNPKVAVFNYAPGPLATDMQEDIRLNHKIDAMREAFDKMHRENNVLDPELSAKMLLKWISKLKYDVEKGTPYGDLCPIHENQFEDIFKGKHLDYFDAL